MPRTKTRTPKPDPYADIAAELQDTVQRRPNYQATMDFHQSMEEMFRDTGNTVMPIAPWHWDDEFSTHVVKTNRHLPGDRPIYVAITRSASGPDLAMMADSCIPGTKDIPPASSDVGYRTSERGTVTVCAVTQDPDQVPPAAERLAQLAEALAETAQG